MFLRVAPFDFIFARLQDFFTEQIPLVHHHDARAALLDDLVGDLFVLLKDAVLGVQHQHGDVAARDGFLGTLDAVKFHRVVHLPRLAHPGGINQNIFLAHALGHDFKRHVHRVARGAGNRTDNDALGFRERVDDGGFADVRPPDDGELERAGRERDELGNLEAGFWFMVAGFWFCNCVRALRTRN